MPDSRLIVRPALAEFGKPQRWGRPGGPAGVTVALCEDFQIAAVIARRGAIPELSERVRRSFAMIPPAGPHRVTNGPLTILGTGPGRWLFLCETRATDFADSLERASMSLASISDHSDGYAVFEVGGPFVRQALAKGVALNLHPNVFSKADAAVTSIAHIGAVLWQIEDAPRYRLAVFRSNAASLWHWLKESALEFGIETKSNAVL